MLNNTAPRTVRRVLALALRLAAVVLPTLECRGPVEIAVGTVTVDPADVTMEPVDSLSLTARVFAPDGSALSGVGVRWISTDTNVVRVAPGGRIRALREGTARVVASAGGRYASATVVSQYPPLTGTRAFAHRAFAMVFPENTLVAVNGAIDLGADGIEVDVALTRDDVPIIMHDQSVNRTTNGSGNVRDLSLAQIRALDACSWSGRQWPSCQVPLALEVIAAVRGRAYLILDLKGQWSAVDLTRLLAMVRQQGMSDSTMITSFHPDQLALVRRIDGRVTLGWLQSTPTDPSAFLGLGRAAVLIEEGAIRRNSASMAAYDSLLASRRSLLGAFTIYDSNRVAPLRTVGVRWYVTDIPLDKQALAAP